MITGVVPFAVIQRHRNLSLSPVEYIGARPERERAAQLKAQSEKLAAQAIEAMRHADEIDARRAADGITVHGS